MAIKLSDLPPDLRRRVMAEAGLQPSTPALRRPKPLRTTPRLSRVCSCLFEMFRPDGDYPDCCDGCGAEWPKSRASATRPPPPAPSQKPLHSTLHSSRCDSPAKD